MLFLLIKHEFCNYKVKTIKSDKTINREIQKDKDSEHCIMNSQVGSLFLMKSICMYNTLNNKNQVFLKEKYKIKHKYKNNMYEVGI